MTNSEKSVNRLMYKNGNQIYIDNSTFKEAIDLIDYEVKHFKKPNELKTLADLKAVYILAYVNSVITVNDLENVLFTTDFRSNIHYLTNQQHDVHPLDSFKVFFNNVQIDVLNTASTVSHKYHDTVIDIIKSAQTRTLQPSINNLIYRKV